MRTLIVLSLLALAAASSYSTERFLFNSWTTEHGYNYATVEELEYRFQVFQQNLAFVNKHNQEAAQGKHTYTVSLNRFAHLTNAEYRATYLNYRRSGINRTGPVFHGRQNVHAPTSIDWRTKGIVTPVKDQGSCGSCWSFSTTGSIEGAHAQVTGSLVSLSEQNLVDCVQNGQFTCDAGGEMQVAFQWVIDNNGIEGESDYPYCACSGNTCNFDKSLVKATISSFTNVAQGDENALLQAAAIRPVSIAIDASQQSFQFYSSGVYNEPNCSSTNLDHGVLVVGYGTLSGVPYWIVKNSWSAGWGDKGYILMSRNRNNQCGIATDASYPTV